MSMMITGAQCITCGRTGTTYEQANFEFECICCEQSRKTKEIKLLTQQSLWVRFLYWLVR